ncbi:glycosyltransferase family 4 protein [Clostridium thermobutyricum]
MKVLYVINSLNIGGAEKMCVDLIKKSKSKGITIDIYLLNNEDTFLKKELEDLNINIFNCGTSRYKSIRHIIWLIKSSKKYDVIHSHLSYSQYYVAIIRSFNKHIRLITTEHSTINVRRKYKIFKKIEKYIYNSYDKIAVINKENFNSISKWQKSIKNKVVVINNGIEIKKYENGSKNNIKDEVLLRVKDRKKILMIAAFRREKNHKLMLEALSSIDDDKILILVGDGDVNIKNEIKNFIKLNRLDNRVIILGKRNDIENIIKFCDVAVLPSLWEGFGLVAAECMAGGLPIIGSNVEGLSEVIGTNRLLFKNNDKEDLISKINGILEDPNISEIVKFCKKRSLKYDINFTLKKYLELYKGDIY